MMRGRWRQIALAAVTLPVAGVLFAWSGVFDVAASSGHWKITDWFLHFAMRSSVRTYALPIDPPAELPRHALQPAAGHFARGCAICHGAPGEARSPAASRMLPQPPGLAGKVGEWSDAQLFYIVKHGVRFTGMPAWPTQARDDEVWAMIAFLRELPGLDRGRYRDLAYGAQAPPTRPVGFDEALAECVRCHGDDGTGRSEITPVIAGQKQAYATAQLQAYADGRRHSGVMALPALGVDEAQLQALAEHFAGLPWPRVAVAPPDADLLAEGEKIARRGIAEKSVPACFACHANERSPSYPRITAQKPAYLKTQLRLFRSGQRGGSDRAHLMTKVAKGLSERDIEALAAFFSNQPHENATSATERR